MNSREVALVSTATFVGALASAFAYHLFLSSPKKQSSRADSSRNGVVSKNRPCQDPFDTSKRKGSVKYVALLFLELYFVFLVMHLQS